MEEQVRYLLVIDMQEDYVGLERNKKRYPYDEEKLIANVNERIDKYSTEKVIYITNKFFWECGKKPKKLVKGLNVVSDNIYEKRKGSCFSNEKLLLFLQQRKVQELEIVGVDGNYCVASSAMAGVKNGFTVFCNESAIGVGKKEKFRKKKIKMDKESVNFI